MESSVCVNHLVVDSGGFIRNADLANLGGQIYTLGGVVAEIRDKATRQRLQVLPYDLCMKEPSAASIKFVSDFAKKTGDYRSLSATDIRVIALAYQLHKEHCGTEALRDVPRKMVQGQRLQNGKDEAGFPGFYMPKESGDSEVKQESHEDRNITSLPAGEGSDVTVCDKQADEVEETDSMTKQTDAVQVKQTDSTEAEQTEHAEAEDSADSLCGVLNSARILDSQISQEEESDDDDDDDDSWVTPDNIAGVKQALGMKSDGARQHCAVGCLTTDFSMQNVMIQIGLHVISVDGLIIDKARSFVLRCRACFKITSQTERRFCPHCGNASLNRLTVTVEDDGTLKYWFSKRWKPNLRGTKFSLPTPQGGKHSSNPILVEDQPVPQQRVSRSAREKTDVWNPDYDYIAQTNPFAVNDVTSRAARLGISGSQARWDKRNPNANHGSKGNKKKHRR